MFNNTSAIAEVLFTASPLLAMVACNNAAETPEKEVASPFEINRWV